MKRLLSLEAELQKRVIGQTTATRVVSEAIQRSRAGLSDPTKPLTTLVFMGPTGVGMFCVTFAVQRQLIFVILFS